MRFRVEVTRGGPEGVGAWRGARPGGAALLHLQRDALRSLAFSSSAPLSLPAKTWTGRRAAGGRRLFTARRLSIGVRGAAHERRVGGCAAGEGLPPLCRVRQLLARQIAEKGIWPRSGGKGEAWRHLFSVTRLRQAHAADVRSAPRGHRDAPPARQRQRRRRRGGAEQRGAEQRAGADWRAEARRGSCRELEVCGRRRSRRSSVVLRCRRASSYLPISPHISPYLPLSPRCEQVRLLEELRRCEVQHEAQHEAQLSAAGAEGGCEDGVRKYREGMSDDADAEASSARDGEAASTRRMRGASETRPRHGAQACFACDSERSEPATEGEVVPPEGEVVPPPSEPEAASPAEEAAATFARRVGACRVVLCAAGGGALHSRSPLCAGACRPSLRGAVGAGPARLLPAGRVVLCRGGDAQRGAALRGDRPAETQPRPRRDPAETLPRPCRDPAETQPRPLRASLGGCCSRAQRQVLSRERQRQRQRQRQRESLLRRVAPSGTRLRLR